MLRAVASIGWFAVAAVLLPAGAASAVSLAPPQTERGFLARLLVNEVPFPGERGYVSEADSREAMVALLWVLHNRTANVPRPYRQVHIATVTTDDIFTVITAGGVRGQVDGFYRDDRGRLRTVNRVEERLDYLARIANDGPPGKFARLLGFADGLTAAYLAGQMEYRDPYAGVVRIHRVPATGGGYSWMTDLDRYHPGGNYLRIPDTDSGGLGGNRFFTLRARPQ